MDQPRPPRRASGSSLTSAQACPPWRMCRSSKRRRSARVVYVDHDPDVTRYAGQLLAGVRRRGDHRGRRPWPRPDPRPPAYLRDRVSQRVGEHHGAVSDTAGNSPSPRRSSGSTASLRAATTAGSRSRCL